MSVKINSLELENVKRIKAVHLEPTENGLTVIGGNNNQGKTSVLDAIAWALGGEKYRPSQAQNTSSVLPPTLRVKLSNGLLVERTGKNSTLKVTDPTGKKSGQRVLDEFIEELALNLPKFMESTSKDKAKILLNIIGVEDQLIMLEKEEKDLYNERLYKGREADQKTKFANEMPFYEGVPEVPVSASELIQKQQEILAKNGENQKKRLLKQKYEADLDIAQKRFDEAKAFLEETKANLEIASREATDLVDESTAELEQQLESIDDTNRKIRANLDKEKAIEDAKIYQSEYDALTEKIEDVRKRKNSLLDGADMPLEGLTVEQGELLYHDQKWDNMSGSEQLRVATAIVRKLNPNCGFVLLDKLEQMDTVTLKEFGEWLESEGLQAIATRVSNGDECAVLIEDGYSIEQKAEWVPNKSWEEEF